MNERPWLRIIGDVHGERKAYLRIITGPEYTLQTGDFDFDYYWLIEQNISPERHRILFGNHDNYDFHRTCPHALGDFGVYSIPNFTDIFFVRGAWSIDFKGRTQFPIYRGKRVVRQKDWWIEEELTHTELQHAIKAYAEKKPDIMISHEAPLSLVSSVTNPIVTHNFGYTQAVIKTRTNQALQAMLDIHAPKLWIFGHYHRAFDRELYPVEGQLMLEGTGPKTRFVCLNILRHIDFPEGFLVPISERA